MSLVTCTCLGDFPVMLCTLDINSSSPTPLTTDCLANCLCSWACFIHQLRAQIKKHKQKYKIVHMFSFYFFILFINVCPQYSGYQPTTYLQSTQMSCYSPNFFGPFLSPCLWNLIHILMVTFSVCMCPMYNHKLWHLLPCVISFPDLHP